MTPGRIDEKVVAERSEWVRDMLVSPRALPLDSLGRFRADPRNVAAAESRLRRALETSVESATFVQLAGYRNRLVRFYQTGSDSELCSIRAERLGDIENVLAGLHRWIREHPERAKADL